MIRSLLIAFLLGALAGAVALHFLVEAPRIELAENAKTAAEGQLEAANTALDRCKEDVASANASLETLREQARLRAEAAQQAVNAATEAARAAGETAQLILAERTPAGVDACIAASAAFDAELRRERGK